MEASHPTQERDGAREVHPRWRLLPWIAGAVFLALALHAARVETPTVDEYAHVPAGLAILEHGRFDVYSKNPPLWKMLLASPVLLSGVEVPEPVVPPFGWGPWTYGQRFEEANDARYLDVFWRARWIPILAVLGTAALLFAWARAVFGVRGAAIATSLFLLSPTVLAHGHLATTDAGAMLTILLFLAALRASLLRPSIARTAVAGALLGLALLVKFTAALVAPAALGLVLWTGRRRPGRALAEVLALAIAALLVVNLGMGFRGSFQPASAYGPASGLVRATFGAVPGALPVPLPADWVRGFDAQLRDTETGEFPSFLLGDWYQGGVWYYHLVAFGVKATLPLLAMLAAAPWLLRRRRPRPGELAFILVPLGVLVFFMCFFNRLNIGVRYLLPIWPLLFLLVAGVFSGTRGWKLPAAALAAFAAAVACVHPNHLGYFNLLAGGPRNGHRVLLDSNLDWGQDLYRLPAALDALGYEGPVDLLYFGHADPALYGLDYRVLPREPVEGVVAVSVNFLMGATYVAREPDGTLVPIRPGHVSWLSGRAPTRRAGSIWIYDMRGERASTVGEDPGR